MTEPLRYHFGFIIEQALGHITHARNLQHLVPQDTSIYAAWGLPEYAVSGLAARLPLYGSNWTVRAGLRTRQALAGIEREIEQCGGQVDALFFHTQATAAFAPDWLARIPSIISMDATPLQMDELGAVYDHPKGEAWLESAKMKIYRLAYTRAKHLVTWSEWARQGLITGYGVPEQKVTVLSPGVDPDLWLRKEPIDTRNERVRILFVGGNLERKGGLMLIEAFQKLKNLTSVPLELHMVTRDAVQAEEGITTYRNLQPNSRELIDLYHASDIFCLPTFGDCLSLVLAEAGAAGLPAISTRVGGIPEVVINGETGCLIPRWDEEALVRALLELIENPALRAQQGENAQKHVLKMHNAAANAARLLELMKGIADENKARKAA